ncbi:DUF2493 domain-containing protein [[Clostridium] innocuum]|uniref:DUF2493 domain-containing protein n=1 Tax=Clostridium innocuum TaxID=1522 RepID=UPI001AF7EDEF|nr:DUF2493 domain-containing protein [[Clostridium] innocuum]QSI27790.1 DUF2493 domain-containing protein [Erysipelotrichaceae bacterium 66202529]DAU14189.1 MAG TPA: Protein of unknown function (DUF2493) [Caudoviricetes sp.]MCC2832102.1 DUF2493 domain-containing protein [[Clostridium] innocuum]MCR0247028.1 DUF2493 domain-containing protein [[Clostridium] innocuum]MCR0258390.1 DUF2493 domain-containing protein [[Clostridium] innocuum]
MNNKEVRIIVAGGRDFNDYDLLSSVLTEYMASCEAVIVSGTAKGADRLGERFASDSGFEIRRFPADWDKHGKSAGIIRNREMADYAGEAIGVLFAFWDGKSRGTKHMISTAKKRGLEVHIIKY